MGRDYYDTLGVKRDAAPDQIKRAYRELALRFHPDRNKSKDAEEKFKEINEAYAVLSDPQKRQQYDMMGSVQFGQTFTADDIFRGFDFSRIFRDLGINLEAGFPGFGPDMGSNPNQLFDMLFGRGGMQIRFAQQCRACNGSGAEKGSRYVTCEKCRGRGMMTTVINNPGVHMEFSTTCDACRGSGKTPEKKCKVCDGRGFVEKQ